MTDKQRAVIEASPDDLRALGWAVAVHNDYRLNGVAHTFWLLTKGDRCIKGEGPTDAAALNVIRAALDADKPEAEAFCGTCKGTQLVNPQRNWVGAIMHPCPDCVGRAVGKEPAR